MGMVSEKFGKPDLGFPRIPVILASNYSNTWLQLWFLCKTGKLTAEKLHRGMTPPLSARLLGR